MTGEVWVGDRGCRVTVGVSDVRETKLLMGAGGPQAAFHQDPSPFLRKALEQIGEYLSGGRRQFDLPLWIGGSSFYNRVWQQLRLVPYGQTVTYAELAERAGNPKAVRAVGGAMRANPLVLLVPCHRVVASGGKLGGFSCGLEWKRWLLNLEAGSSLEAACPSRFVGVGAPGQARE